MRPVAAVLGAAKRRHRHSVPPYSDDSGQALFVDPFEQYSTIWIA
jgi:hypothetical protein